MWNCIEKVKWLYRSQVLGTHTCTPEQCYNGNFDAYCYLRVKVYYIEPQFANTKGSINWVNLNIVPHNIFLLENSLKHVWCVATK